MAKAKRRVKKTVYEGNVYIQATFNNTIVAYRFERQCTLLGKCRGLGFRGAKSTLCGRLRAAPRGSILAFAVHVYVRAPGNESAIRTLLRTSVKVFETSLPFLTMVAVPQDQKSLIG